MSTSTDKMDLGDLRAELKAWERDFKTKNSRDATREDIKKVPDIDAKYKIYNKSRSKPSIEKPTFETNTARSNFPLGKSKGVTKTISISSDSSLTAVETGLPTEQTFNPFRSPAKGGPSLKRPIPKPSVRLDEDPFAAGEARTPSASSLFAKFANPSPTPPGQDPKKSIFPTANVTASPLPMKPLSQASDPFGDVAQPAQPPPSFPTAKYVHAASPSKLRTLIEQSKSVDTPRTKARKRLAGEEDWTPMKKPRLGALRLAADKEKDEDEVLPSKDVDMEPEFGPTPKKTNGPKRFKPIFESPMQPDPKAKGIFSKRTVSFNVPPRASRTPSLPPDPPATSGTATSLKRPASPDGRTRTSGLLPPSPPAVAPGSKPKSRKRAKKAKKGEKETEEDDQDSSDKEVREIPYTIWGGLKGRRRTPARDDGSEDEIWDLAMHRNEPTGAHRFAEEFVEEEMTVRLPTDMFGLLDLESPRKGTDDEDSVVRRIFQPGKRESAGDVWVAGEMTSGSHDQENDDDWEDEVDGWKGMADL